MVTGKFLIEPTLTNKQTFSHENLLYLQESIGYITEPSTKRK